MRKCSNCAENNRAGALVCEYCGAMLTQKGMTDTKRLNVEELRLMEQHPQQATQHLMFAPDAALALQFRELPDPLVYRIQTELLIGRYDKKTDESPDIDMHRFAGYLMGVSRLHARFIRQQDRLFLEDLGSSNGTYLNERQLLPNQPVIVSDNSDVRLGKLKFRVFFA